MLIWASRAFRNAAKPSAAKNHARHPLPARHWTTRSPRTNPRTKRWIRCSKAQRGDGSDHSHAGDERPRELSRRAQYRPSDPGRPRVTTCSGHRRRRETRMVGIVCCISRNWRTVWKNSSACLKDVPPPSRRHVDAALTSLENRQAIETADQGEGVVLLMDLGSSVMTAEMAPTWSANRARCSMHPCRRRHRGGDRRRARTL